MNPNKTYFDDSGYGGNLDDLGSETYDGTRFQSQGELKQNLYGEGFDNPESARIINAMIADAFEDVAKTLRGKNHNQQPLHTAEDLSGAIQNSATPEDQASQAGAAANQDAVNQ